MATSVATKPAAIKGFTKPRLYTPPLAENCDTWLNNIRDADPSIRDIVKRQPEDDDGLNLKPAWTNGYAAIKFATDMLHMSLFPWQEWLLIHGLELILDDNENYVYRFRTVIVEVGRQNGKTVVEVVLALWIIYSQGGQTVIGAAQDLANAERAWRDGVALAESDDELCELMDDHSVYQGHPKSLTLTNGSEYRVTSTAPDAGRGFSGDLILLDELRTHKNWLSWSAVTNTMNARPKGQVWAFSNAGNLMSVVLRFQRALAHRDLGWPDGEREFDGVLDDIDAELAEMLEATGDLKPGWFEWSAPPDAKRTDMKALAQSNPSVNHTDVSLKCPTTRTLLAGVAGSPAYEVETEILCRWATMGVGGPFPEGSWEDTQKPKAAATKESVKVVCVEVSSRRNQTYVARAGLNTEKNFVVAMRYDHPGTDWVVEALLKDKAITDAIVIRTDVGGSTLSLVEDIKRLVIGPKILEWKGGDVNVAHGQMFDRLRDRTIEHLPHPGLDIAATSAVSALKPGGGFTVDILRSPSDTAALYAAIGAVWGLEQLTGNDYDILKSVM